MTKVNFGGLKQKLLASIVAISAIQVLKAFMNMDTVFDAQKMGWLVGVHLVFVVSAAVLALSDRWAVATTAASRVGKGALAPCPPSGALGRNGGHGAKRAPLPTRS